MHNMTCKLIIDKINSKQYSNPDYNSFKYWLGITIATLITFYLIFIVVLWGEPTNIIIQSLILQTILIIPTSTSLHLYREKSDRKDLKKFNSVLSEKLSEFDIKKHKPEIIKTALDIKETPIYKRGDDKEIKELFRTELQKNISLAA